MQPINKEKTETTIRVSIKTRKRIKIQRDKYKISVKNLIGALIFDMTDEDWYKLIKKNTESKAILLDRREFCPYCNKKIPKNLNKCPGCGLRFKGW